MTAGLLEGKNAIVTGAGQGIGLAVVEAFAEQGANVWAMVYEPEAWDAAILHLRDGQWVKPVALDLSDDSSIKDAFGAVRAEKLPVDVLVNNAGIMDTAMFQMTRDESLERQMQVNFSGAFKLTQLVSKLMVRRKSGSIVNLSSCVALDSTPGKAAYAASKAALIGMTRSIAKELGSFGIRANCVAPSAVDTGLLDGTTQEAIDEIANGCALGRIARPEEIAQVILFLASGMSSYVSGQVLRVDGCL